MEAVRSGNLGLSYAGVANDGTLVYIPGGEETAAHRSVVWVDRQGHEEIAINDLQPYGYPRISPDGGRLAVHVETNAGSHILVYDLVRKTSMRLTFNKTGDIRPSWTPDGRSVFFRGESEGLAIYSKASDRSGAVERVTTLSGDGSATSFSPDGRILIFNSFGSTTNRDIWALNLDDKKVRQLISEPGSQGNGAVSPNGRWLAYSDEIEGYIVVTSFPDVTAGRWQISPAGSKWPLWSRDGRELFYVSGEPRTMMAVPVESSESAFKWGTPRALFPTAYVGFEGHTGARNYDLSLDGRRFLVVKNPESQSQAPPLVVVENWFEELKQRVPVK